MRERKKWIAIDVHRLHAGMMKRPGYSAAKSKYFRAEWIE